MPIKYIKKLLALPMKGFLTFLKKYVIIFIENKKDIYSKKAKQNFTDKRRCILQIEFSFYNVLIEP